MGEFGDKWAKDKLNRIDDAIFLSDYLIAKHELKNTDLNTGSFVLNVNAEWGFGKTYFLKNWADDLVSKQHPVVYFDAWQNDFSKEPLLALISTINEQLTPFFNTSKTKRALKEWYKTSRKLISPSSPFLLGILAKKLFSMSSEELDDYLNEEENDSNSLEDNLNESNEDSSSGTSEEVENTVGTVISKAAGKMLETHHSTKKTIIEFKDNLGKLTKHLETLKTINTPIFIFIDELDRCRPDYAIEVLENIKHLFGVPGVFFVVATASEQLSHSIKAVYGQDFDGSNYLKRFFDQTYTMHDPDRYSYSEYLFSIYDLTNRENLYSPLDSNQCKTSNSLIEAFAWLTSIFECGLRDMEQYCIVIDSISLTFKEEKIHILFLLFLMILKDKDYVQYKNFPKGVTPDMSKMDVNSIEFQKKFITHNHRENDKEIGISQLISYYIRFSKMTLKALNEARSSENSDTYVSGHIMQILLQDMPSTWDGKNEPKHSLLKYPMLIEQAGRLS